MLIIVEGPDGAGKTTFVEMLRQMLAKEGEVEVQHYGPPKEWPVSLFELGTQGYRPGRGQNLICDRQVMSEPVYGKVLRGTHMSAGEYDHVEGWLNRLGAVVVFLMPPYTDVLINMLERGDDLVAQEDLYPIYHGYVAQLNQSKLCHQVLHNYPTEDSARSAIKLGQRIEQLYADTTDLVSFVGWKWPQVLFIGDAKSKMAGEHVQAFTPWPKRSGALLMDAIQDKYLTWALINAMDEPSLGHAVSVINPQKIVALGGVASAECSHYNIQVDAHVWHPAYAQRRRGLTAAQYRELI